jgi:hypothetical protein
LQTENGKDKVKELKGKKGFQKHIIYISERAFKFLLAYATPSPTHPFMIRAAADMPVSGSSDTAYTTGSQSYAPPSRQVFPSDRHRAAGH